MTTKNNQMDSSATSGEACAYPLCKCDFLSPCKKSVAAPQAATPLPELEDEESAKDGWRRLALQFDGHRMQALGHLRAMLQDPAKHAPVATEFLGAPPLSGEKVLAQRIAALALQAAPVAPTLSQRLNSPDRIDAYARQLAMGLWRTHYRATSPEFELLDDTYGVLSQIDNMLTGLVLAAPEAPATTASAQPPGTRKCGVCEGKGVIYQCVICGADEPGAGSCGSDDPRALCKWKATTASASGEKCKTCGGTGWVSDPHDIEHGQIRCTKCDRAREMPGGAEWAIDVLPKPSRHGNTDEQFVSAVRAAIAAKEGK
jgi:hypothetical protein